MTFESTPERAAYLASSGSVALNACPGSGKTTTVAHKVALLEQGWIGRFGAHSGIACLSFTNVAKNEIADIFRQTSGHSLAYPHTVSTIDSFVNLNITLPFVHHILPRGQRVRIVDDVAFLDRFFDNQWALKKKYSKLFYRYQASLIEFTISGSYKYDGHESAHEPQFSSYCEDAKKAQLKAGLLKTSDSAFLAVRLLKAIPRIGKYLVKRFPYIIVDEAQDTSDIQHAILDCLQVNGLENLELVGDPYQCLYEWRDASPDLFLQKHKSSKWQGLTLSENRRSSQKIVDAFSLLRNPSEKAIFAVNRDSSALPVHILLYDSSDFQPTIRRFAAICRLHGLEDNRVLVRGNSLKNTLLGLVPDFKPWNSDLPYQLVRSQLHFRSNELSDAIRILRRALLVALDSTMSFDSIRTLEEELQSDNRFHSALYSTIRKLPDFAHSVSEWTTRAQQLLTETLTLEVPLDFQIRRRGSKNLDIRTLSLPMEAFFRGTPSMAQLPVMTVHQAKGMTFDSVLLILSANSKGQSISIMDCQRPANVPSEKQRIIYVAMSRPRHLLCLGVPRDTSQQLLRERFGSSIEIE